jgi:hypothetical protein
LRPSTGQAEGIKVTKPVSPAGKSYETTPPADDKQLNLNEKAIWYQDCWCEWFGEVSLTTDLSSRAVHPAVRLWRRRQAVSAAGNSAEEKTPQTHITKCLSRRLSEKNNT